jgi:integration host factor subunit alpha
MVDSLFHQEERRHSMALTKADLIDRIFNSTDLPKTRSSELVDALLEIMKAALENGEDLLITGFGKFCVKQKGVRMGRNPQTGEQLMLKPRRVVVFKCSGTLRKKINGRAK